MTLSPIAADTAARSIGSPAASGGAASSMPLKLAGETGVLVRDTSSVLLDAQEEIGLMRSGDRSLESRKPRAGADSKAINIQLAAEYLSAQGATEGATDALEGGAADRFIDSLRERDRQRGTGGEGARELTERLRERLLEDRPDTAHDRFALLVQARERLRNEGGGTAQGADAALLPVVESEIDRLSREEGPVLRAGFNADRRVRANAGLDGRAGLTSLYIEHVLQGGTMSAIHSGVTELYGRDRFAQAMEFLLGAAGDDMASIGPSAERPALAAAVDALHRLQMLVSVDDHCGLSLERLGGWVKPGTERHALLDAVLRLQEESWPLSSAVRRECQAIVHDLPQAWVAFHNQFCELVEQIPERAFPGERERRQLIDVVREARDEAVAHEEEEQAPA